MYDEAQICLNGHLITSRLEDYPESSQKYCANCGEETISRCQGCQTPIRGQYIPDTAIWIDSYSIPRFCHNCGRPYPWTTRRIEAAKELSQTIKGLTDEQKASLEKSLDELVLDSPKTEIAAITFKSIMSTVGKETYSAMKSILTDILSETVRKLIFSG